MAGLKNRFSPHINPLDFVELFIYYKTNFKDPVDLKIKRA